MLFLIHTYPAHLHISAKPIAGLQVRGSPTLPAVVVSYVALG